MSDNAVLEQLQRQVADREPVDWNAATSELQASSTTSAEDLKELALLRLLDEITLAHTSLQPDAIGGATDHPAPPAAVPRTEDDTLQSWGRYRLEETVGRGGFGSVYRAWDPVLEMPVAIKILHPRFSDQRLRARLVHEGRALAKVEHRNVVRVLNVEEHDGRLGLVMEFVRGETLDALIGRGTLNDREATLIAEDVCRALAAVHAHKLIHRDVKARNIMRERTGRLVLMDFGAGLWEDDAADQKGAVGTPLYMAPETLRGAAASVASDVYSVGVLLFYLTTGRHPVEGRTLDDIRAAQASGRRTSLLALRPDLPLPFVKVVERALTPEPANRYPTSTALLQALLEARDAGPDWKRRLVHASLAAAGLAVALTLAGLISSLAFNRTLGLGEYTKDTVILTWLAVGAQAMVLPIVLALLGVGLVGLSAAARNILVSSTRLRAVDRAVYQRCVRVARGLSLNDAGVCSGWLVLATALGLLAAWIYWMPLLDAVSRDISTAPAGALGLLAGERNAPYRTSFRMLLSLLAAGTLTGWYVLARTAAARGARIPSWLAPTEIAILVLLYGSMQIPYRIIHEATTFEAVTWRGQACHVLGRRADEALVFCSELMPRSRVVRASRERLETDTARERGNLFKPFAPPDP
jgi:tRNA A-37 threonylcarbamoyl transferase component Bud32